MPGFLLDTNILIKALRKQPAALDLIDSLWAAQEAVWISVLSRTEVLAGMHPHEETRTLTLLDSLDELVIDGKVADLAGRLIYRSAREGSRLSFPDALIAATALKHGLTLVTANARHFAVPDLQVQEVA